MTDPDPWQDPGWLEYAEYAREEMLPMLKGASITLAFLNGEPDPKQACELGYMVLLDKPILAVVQPGVKVPDKLIRIADEIVEGGELDDPKFKERLLAAMARMNVQVRGQ